MRCVGLGGKLCICALSVLLSSCVTSTNYKPATLVRVSVHDQALEVVQNGAPTHRFPVSTSRFGLGDQPNSFRTPLGRFVVQNKIGDGVPLGGKFYHRRYTGERVDLKHGSAAGHDSLLTRILWLRGLEEGNRNAYSRGIYIHGTNQESLVGQPASYGCIRMRNRDVLALYELVPVGSLVVIQPGPLSSESRLVSTAVAARPAAFLSQPAEANLAPPAPKALPVQGQTHTLPPAPSPRVHRSDSVSSRSKRGHAVSQQARSRQPHRGHSARSKHLAKAALGKTS
ncbi:Putative L,D-transpeptidase YkuD [Methylacidimicrobium cyclopophantes]|uniref:L,D-transpeptidase YkuD n=1 Tax=Methylacidimicrobium cyclopophantes TaxID=1041766 RepID=A0A5E6M771_9BACT|nr:L,D-transpeptidase family protein [Methylacidimicrobium cyclopophantes]VVM05161.1 Putative L,D-transpeptidase YkuD [Methylacidimicrobium cyclopophantes]